MSMSKHIPQTAGGIESVTGSLEIDTGVRRLLAFAPALVATAIAANEESIVTWAKSGISASGTQLVTLYVFKGGTNHGDPGDSAVDVSWYALGD